MSTLLYSTRLLLLVTTTVLATICPSGSYQASASGWTPSGHVHRSAQVAAKIPVTIETTVTPPVLDPGQPVTVTFTIKPGAVSTQLPGGTVTLYDSNNQPICAVPVHSSGSCTFVPVARGTVFIDYSGDDFFEANRVGVFIPIRIKTTLSVNPVSNPARAGQIITLTAGISSYGVACDRVYSCAPTGQVTYYDNGRFLASAGVHPRVGAVFPVTVTLTLVGKHTIVGFYSGDSSYMPSSSASITTNVLPLEAYLPSVIKP